MTQGEGPVPQLPKVLVFPAKQLLGLRHLTLESGDALRGLTEQPQDLPSRHVNRTTPLSMLI